MKKLYFTLVLFMLVSMALGQVTIHIPADYNSIQDGINAASNGDIVLVDEGKYVENIFFNGKKITVASQYLIDGDETHIEKTIIDGSSASGEEYASVVHFISGEDTTSVLMGFTLINGEGYQNRMGGGILVSESGARIVSNHIIGSKLVAWQSKGAGIFAASWDMQSNFKVIIENNIIEGDSAYCVLDDGAFGGGIYIETMNARIKGNTIFDCLANGGVDCLGGAICCLGYNKNHLIEILENEIYNNKCRGTNNIGGGLYVYNCLTHIIDNHIYKNVCEGEETYFSFAQGGGASLEKINDGSLILGNLIEKNKCTNGNFQTWGGGLQIYNPEDADESLNLIIVDGNTIRKNKALWGAGSLTWRSNVVFSNNFFDDNYAQEYGGAIYLAGTINDEITIPIINNTFYSNASVSSGASIYCSTANANNVLLMNNVFWKNLGADEITAGQTSLAIFNCNIELDSVNGEWEGAQNFRKDPMFNSGCVLNMNSPCLNKGIDNIFVFDSNFNAPVHDIRRIMRPQGEQFDVGAYEVSVGTVDTLNFQDLWRLYTVYLPGGKYNRENYPVIINLHGEDKDAQFQMDWSGMNITADENGFIVVYPDGVDGEWNYSLNGEVDDVGFINALIDDVIEKYPVDTERIYVCGFSSGGIMASTLVSELNARIVAFATLSGAPGYIEQSDAHRKIPALVMHGTDDNTVDYSYAENLVSFWNDHNSTILTDIEQLPDNEPFDSCTVEKQTYSDIEHLCEVLMYKIINGGHQSWPGAFWRPDTTQNMNMDINANDKIWAFFNKYRLSDFISSVPEKEQSINNLQIYPNPFTTSTTLSYELIRPEKVILSIYNQMGKQVYQTQENQSQGIQQLNWNAEGYGDGIYYYSLRVCEQITIGKLVKVN